MSEHESWCALNVSDPAAGKSCDCGVAEDAEQVERDTDQLAWDRFAASAPIPRTGSNTGVGWNAVELAAMAADYADALYIERHNRAITSGWRTKKGRLRVVQMSFPQSRRRARR